MSLPPAYSKEGAKPYLPVLAKHHYVPIALVAEFLGATEQSVRNWISRGELAGANLASGWSVSTASLRNMLVRKSLMVPGFNCPDIKDWTPEMFDMIPRDASLEKITETQAAAVLLKVARSFNGSFSTNRLKLQEVVTTINRSLAAIALAQRADSDG